MDTVIAALLDGAIDKYTWGIMIANKFFFGTIAFLAWEYFRYRAKQTKTTADDELIAAIEKRFPFFRNSG